MQTIDLAQVQNQTFNVNIDDIRYDFNLYLFNGFICFDLAIAGLQIYTAKRIVAGSFLISDYCYAQAGNFLLLTNNEQLPNYQQFGISQTLIYLATSEIQAAVAAAPVPSYLPAEVWAA